MKIRIKVINSMLIPVGCDVIKIEGSYPVRLWGAVDWELSSVESCVRLKEQIPNPTGRGGRGVGEGRWGANTHRWPGLLARAVRTRPELSGAAGASLLPPFYERKSFLFSAIRGA